jgi:hypothetical protein
MYNVYAVPFWPMKVYWTLKKVILISFDHLRSQPIVFVIGSDHRFDQRLPRPS